MTRKDTFDALDEEFAAAADEFFAGTLQKTNREDTELSALLDTLQRVDEAFSDDETEARERIRKNLRKAWFAEQETMATKRPSFQSRIRDFFWQNKQRSSLALSFAMILLVLVLIPVLFRDNPVMAGTAGGLGSSTLFVIVLFIVFISALIWVLKSKK